LKPRFGSALRPAWSLQRTRRSTPSFVATPQPPARSSAPRGPACRSSSGRSRPGWSQSEAWRGRRGCVGGKVSAKPPVNETITVPAM
jgi:hypothetical protein